MNGEPPDPARTLRLAPTLAPLLAAAEPVEPRAAFARLSQMGFRAVQLSATQPGMRPRDLDRSARRDLLALLRRHELDLAGIDAWIPAAHFADAAHADRAVSAARGAIELAADLGRACVSLSLPEEGGAEAETALAAHANRHGVAIADHRYPAHDVDGLGVGIDPAQWLNCGADPAAGITMHANRLASARLCDFLRSGTRGPIGEPQEDRLDVLAYKVALSVSGYRRPVIVDARQWTNPWDGLEQTKKRWEAL